MPRVLAGHEGIVEAVAFSPDGGSIASAGCDGAVRIWSRTTGRETVILKGHHGIVADLSFDPLGDRLVSAGLDDGTVRVWDARTGDALPGSARARRSPVTRARFSPDGREIVTSTHPGPNGTKMSSGEIKVRNATTGVERITLALEPSATPVRGIRAVCYSPDGKWIAASIGNLIHAWNAANGAPAWTLPGHDDDVFNLAFSADSCMLASAGKDQKVKLWNTQTRKLIRTVAGTLRGSSQRCLQPRSASSGVGQRRPVS